MRTTILSICCWLALAPALALAQTEGTKPVLEPGMLPPDDPTLTTDVMPTIDLNTKRKDRFGGALSGVMGALKKGKSAVDSAKALANAVKEEAAKAQGKNKKNAEPKNTFYGIKATRMFIRHASGVIEKFYVLREYGNPPAHTDGVYYYDREDQKLYLINPLERALRLDKDKHWLVHGPYIKTKGENILEMGNFYAGVKHGRWERFDKNFVLIEKMHYNRGLARDTEVVYHDEKKNKVKEIVPLQYGLRHGTYIAYHPSGRLRERGQYQFGAKIGRWREFYDQDATPRQRETIYPKDFYDDKTQAYVAREWDNRGKVVTDVKR
jgi:antitoxin component YwqK of YwqJK toxin-antitoxin module